MSFLDNFLNIMKLNDDDYDDDFFDDDYEDEPEEKPKKNLFKKERNYDDDLDETPKSKPSHTTNSKVVPMRSTTGKRGLNMEVCVVKPTSMEDSREICETLLNGSTVILNLEGLDLDCAQRIIDFASGATYAISGNLQKISNYIFLVTPTNVGISGDLQDLLNASFDVSSIKSKY